MTPQEINKAIAECCGWTHGNLNDHEIMFKDRQSACVAQGRIHKQRIEMGIDPTRGTTPDYYNDLNAMQEAENYMMSHDGDDIFVYYDQINELIAKKAGYDACLYQMSAKASVRAEAFLRTKGLWK
jgi:hypothetical protein